MEATYTGIMATVIGILSALGVWLKSTYNLRGEYIGAALLVVAMAFALAAKATGELDASWLMSVLIGLGAGLAVNGAYSLTKAVAGK